MKGDSDVMKGACCICKSISFIKNMSEWCMLSSVSCDWLAGTNIGSGHDDEMCDHIRGKSFSEKQIGNKSLATGSCYLSNTCVGLTNLALYQTCDLTWNVSAT